MDCHFSDPKLGWPKVSLFRSYMAHPIDIPTFDLKQAMLSTQDLGTRGTNQRGTTFGARSLEHIHLGHTANGALSQKGHRLMEHNHWGTAPLGHRVKRHRVMEQNHWKTLI